MRKEGGRDVGKEGGREGGKDGGSACKLCGRRQTLLHVLNNCPKALNSCRYNEQHDAHLQVHGQELSVFFWVRHWPPSGKGVSWGGGPTKESRLIHHTLLLLLRLSLWRC